MSSRASTERPHLVISIWIISAVCFLVDQPLVVRSLGPTMYKGSVYSTVNGSFTYAQAAGECRERQGRLAVLKTSDRQIFAVLHAGDDRDWEAHIGLRKMNDIWTWEDGTTLKPWEKAWQKGFSPNVTGNDCAVLTSLWGVLKAVPCHRPIYTALCEFDYDECGSSNPPDCPRTKPRCINNDFSYSCVCHHGYVYDYKKRCIRALMHDVVSSPDLINDVIVWKKGGVFEPWRIAHTYHDTDTTTSIAEQCQPGVKELVFEKRSRRMGVGSSIRGNFTVTQAILMPDTKDWKPADQVLDWTAKLLKNRERHFRVVPLTNLTATIQLHSLPPRPFRPGQRHQAGWLRADFRTYNPSCYNVATMSDAACIWRRQTVSDDRKFGSFGNGDYEVRFLHQDFGGPFHYTIPIMVSIRVTGTKKIQCGNFSLLYNSEPVTYHEAEKQCHQYTLNHSRPGGKNLSEDRRGYRLFDHADRDVIQCLEALRSYDVITQYGDQVLAIPSWVTCPVATVIDVSSPVKNLFLHPHELSATMGQCGEAYCPTITGASVADGVVIDTGCGQRRPFICTDIMEDEIEEPSPTNMASVSSAAVIADSNQTGINLHDVDDHTPDSSNHTAVLIPRPPPTTTIVLVVFFILMIIGIIIFVLWYWVRQRNSGNGNEADHPKPTKKPWPYHGGKRFRSLPLKLPFKRTRSSTQSSTMSFDVTSPTALNAKLNYMSLERCNSDYVQSPLSSLSPRFDSYGATQDSSSMGSESRSRTDSQASSISKRSQVAPPKPARTSTLERIRPPPTICEVTAKNHATLAKSDSPVCDSPVTDKKLELQRKTKELLEAVPTATPL